MATPVSEKGARLFQLWINNRVLICNSKCDNFVPKVANGTAYHRGPYKVSNYRPRASMSTNETRLRHAVQRLRKHQGKPLPSK